MVSGAKFWYKTDHTMQRGIKNCAKCSERNCLGHIFVQGHLWLLERCVNDTEWSFFGFFPVTWLVKMGQSPLNVAEWEAVLAKMLRYHDNISKEIGTLVIEIKAGMKSELVPVAEDKANYGKVVHARASRQGGGQGLSNFWNTKAGACSTNAQSRFASAVLDNILRPPHIVLDCTPDGVLVFL